MNQKKVMQKRGRKEFSCPNFIFQKIEREALFENPFLLKERKSKLKTNE